MAQNNTTGLLPVAWGSSPGLVSAPVLPPNPTRTGLVFINNGPVALAICPATMYLGQIALTAGAYAAPPLAPGVAVIGGPGSVTMQPGDKFIIDNMSCTCAWNGIAAAVGAALTIFEML
jgi:hypothetical protein